jgi:4-carboxymuconolactone decarboxylase
MEQIGTFLNKRSSLSEREVETVIILIARHWKGDYVETAHVRMGRKIGLSDAVIEALLAGNDPNFPDPHEAAVYKFASAMIASRKLSDAEFAEVEKTLGRNGIAEVLVLLGYYTSVAMAMKVHEVPIPPA